MKASGRGLDKKDWFGKSDPYLEIHRMASPPVLVYRSQVWFGKSDQNRMASPYFHVPVFHAV
jgi:hypothetical protein